MSTGETYLSFAPADVEPLIEVKRREISFTVYGKPVPQGSSRAFIPKGWKRPVITTDNKKLKPWRQEVSDMALALNVAAFPDGTPIEATLNFYFRRPKSSTVKKRPGMTVKPDIDKICRSIFDSITGILIQDDAQIVELRSAKHYGDPERVTVLLREAAL